MKRVPWFFLCLCLTLMLAFPACAETASVTGDEYARAKQDFEYTGYVASPLVSLTFKSTNASTVAVGSKIRLRTTYVIADAVQDTVVWTWISSNPSVASVVWDEDENGPFEDNVQIKGVAAGSAVITVTVETATGDSLLEASCTITVSNTSTASEGSAVMSAQRYTSGTTYAEDAISITMATSGQVVLNPYGLNVPINGRTYTDSIASPVCTIENNCSAAINVDVVEIQGFTDTEGNLVFLDSYPGSSVDEESVLMYLEMSGDNTWANGYGDYANQILVTRGGASKADMLTVASGDTGYFQLKGSLYNADGEFWDANDYVDSVFVAFSFSQVVEEQDPVESVDPADPAAVSEEDELDESAAPETDPATESTETPAESEEPETETETPVEETQEPEAETETPAEESEDPGTDTENPAEETAPSDEGTEDPGSTSEGSTEQTDSETTAEP